MQNLFLSLAHRANFAITKHAKCDISRKPFCVNILGYTFSLWASSRGKIPPSMSFPLYLLFCLLHCINNRVCPMERKLPPRKGSSNQGKETITPATPTAHFFMLKGVHAACCHIIQSALSQTVTSNIYQESTTSAQCHHSGGAHAGGVCPLGDCIE